jgi:1-acyl-sn-glycerol-3-phosphate acyltransferase
VLACNHAKRYAPMSLFFNINRKMRIWSLYSLFYVKTFSNHMMFDIYPNARGVKRIFFRIMTSVAAVIGPFVFRMIECIPVYRQSLRLKETFDKTIETLEEGKDVLIFPESRQPDPNYKYVNQLQKGFFRYAPDYYKKTGKRLKVFPIYCCAELKKIVVGAPYEYDPDKEFHLMNDEMLKHVQDTIESLALSLPPHRPVPYGENFKDIEYDKQKYKGIF